MTGSKHFRSMAPSFLLLLLLSIGGTVLGQNDGGETADIGIPEKFFGAFQLDHSDNWDQYLVAKGKKNKLKKSTWLAKFSVIFGTPYILFSHPSLCQRLEKNNI